MKPNTVLIVLSLLNALLFGLHLTGDIVFGMEEGGREILEFVRIHRSTVVNLEYVERLEPSSHAGQHVYLSGVAEPLTLSRRFGARLRDRFG